MRIKKADKDWLEEFCGDHTDDVIDLIKSYIKQTRAECKNKQ